ncbi:MAG: cell division topological specificity factor MinE [Chloroflexi bacterium]|nr:cell division topological specificity factor MinE [Chloroflexota bacterium]
MSFFDRISGRKDKSAQNAKERLQLVLIHDRTDLTPAVLDALKDDLLDAISRHVEIDPASVRIDIARDGRSQRLVADIPLRSVSRRRTR